VWLLKRFLPDWHDAVVEYVPAGQRLERLASSSKNEKLNAIRYTLEAIDKVGEDEIIHVDTGLGPLDHHQIESDKVSAASLTWEFIKDQRSKINPSASLRARDQSSNEEKLRDREAAIGRMVKVIVDIDHFKEVFWDNPTADYHNFSFLGILEGLKVQKPNQDFAYIEFGIQILDALLHKFESRIWAEKELKKGQEFETRFGKAMGIETINDSVVDLSQKMGYVIVVRKDPRKGYVRIKAHPGKEINLTLVYEKLKKMDPDATWFLHISKKMLLNGSVKNPKMRPTTLTLDEIIKVLESV
ncbi:MAG: hypothetical protein Q7S38_00500, partial [bacterium]|nr:hypothetical protein [bacterium]